MRQLSAQHAASNLAVKRTLLAVAGAGLIVGVWDGLIRVGLALPVGGIIDPTTHGIVLVSGFFGALISLERAVALGRPWAYLAPPAATIGALGLGAGLPGAAWWSLAGAMLVTASCVVLWRTQRTLFMAAMVVGSASWAVAVGLQIRSSVLDHQVVWLMTFLVVTIVAERLELSRLAPPSPWKTPIFVSAVIGLGFADLMVSAGIPGGWHLLGAALLAVAVWLAVFDVARRTVRMGGVTRFIAVCLLSGYGWLAVAGGWWLLEGNLAGTLHRDAALHAVFVGFVLAMVFGHVYMVAPAVLGVDVPYHRWFAIHLVLLHVSLAARVGGDLVGNGPVRQWGAIGNAAAIVVFLVAVASSVVAARRHQTLPQRAERSR